ncbi:hypothetical protein EV426DRAFT_209770 [Tirmania nivea]|nr:hypothetical protein EV426DRAFT_209770 [Tirmania nivea]
MDLTGMEAMDLTGMEDSADSDYVEEVSEISSDQEEEKEDEEDEEDEDEEIIGTPKRKKILLDSSQSSLSPLHSPSLLPRTFKPQKGRPPTYVLKREPRYSGRKHANDFYESSDSRSISPSARPLTPRGRNRRVSPHIIASKSKKQRTNCSRYTLSPINTELTSPFPSRHRSRSPVNTSRSPISQPPCLRMSLTGNDDEIFTIPLSEVLTPAELETAIQTHFPQPADTYIKLTDDRGDIIKLSFWKGGVWKDGLRVRVEYRDNTSGESRSRTSSGAALWPRSTTEKSVKVGMVDAGVQTQGVEVYDIGWAEKREAKIVEELTERLKKVDRVIVERAEMKVKEKRKSMEQELREEKERLHQKQKQREKELEEQGLELQFGSQAQVKEVPPLLSAGAPPKSEVPMPTPNTSAHTSRNSSTDLATPTKLQFAALSLSLATARRDPPPKQRQPAQQQKASPKKWSPSTDADEGNDSGSDLSLDLSWDSSKRVASAEKQKSKSKPKPRGEHHNTSIAAAGGGGSLEVPSWVLSSAKKQKNRECSISLNSTPPRLKGKSSASASKAHPASTQSQEELSLFIGSQLTDSSAESSPGVGPPLGDGLTPPEEVRRQTASPDPALVTHSKEPAVRKGGTPICLARRSGKAGLARGGGVLGSVVGTGRSSGTETTEAGEGGSVHQEWYTLGGWVAQRPGEMDL